MSKYSSNTTLRSPIVICARSFLSKTLKASRHSSRWADLFHLCATTVFKNRKSTPVLFVNSPSKRLRSVESSEMDSLLKPKLWRMFLNCWIEMTSRLSLSRSAKASYKSDRTSTGSWSLLFALAASSLAMFLLSSALVTLALLLYWPAPFSLFFAYILYLNYK